GELPPGAKTLPVNGYNMAYVENGGGRPLIMVHGALTDYRSWSAQMEPLGRSNRAVAVSLRHYFPERWDGKGGNFSWKQHVADTIAFIKALNAGPVDLIGHSRGGLIAFEIARAQPTLLRSPSPASYWTRQALARRCKIMLQPERQQMSEPLGSSPF